MRVRLGKLLVGNGQRRDDLLVDLVTNVALAFESDRVLEARAFGNSDRCERLAGVFSLARRPPS